MASLSSLTFHAPPMPLAFFAAFERIFSSASLSLSWCLGHRPVNCNLFEYKTYNIVLLPSHCMDSSLYWSWLGGNTGYFYSKILHTILFSYTVYKFSSQRNWPFGLFWLDTIAVRLETLVSAWYQQLLLLLSLSPLGWRVINGPLRLPLYTFTIVYYCQLEVETIEWLSFYL